MLKAAIINQKGGTGKTTSAVNISAGLVRLDKKVLVIDMDPQAHLTYSLGIAAHKLDHTIYHLLKGQCSLEEVLLSREGLDVIPTSLELSSAELELVSEPGREFLLKNALQSLNDRYDYLFIDCPPSLGLLTLNALVAADGIIIPLQTEFLSLQGTATLLKTVKVVRDRINPALRILGVVATQFDARKVLNREVVETIRKQFKHKTFETIIRDNVALAEAPSQGKHIFAYDPKSNGAEDYQALCREMITRFENG